MSPEGAFIALVLGILVDKWGIGGPRLTPLFNRLAFAAWVTVFAVGFKESGLTQLISGTVSGIFAMIASLWDAPIFVGAVQGGPKVLGMIVAGIVLGAMMPERINILGGLSKIDFADLRVGGGMSNTGVARGASGGSGGVFKKLFPGTVNIGMVALALLFVTSGTVVNGGIGGAIDWTVSGCASVMGPIVHIFLAATEPA